MDPGTRPPDPEELLANAAWVRRIARRLVDDPQRAEDVAQDALAVALERRPGFAGDTQRFRRWLGGVVRHLAARGRRERERPAREREAGLRRDAEPAADDAVARLELHRVLTAAVLELDEPYRSTVALRYFDGLSPRAIAARQGVEGATVRKRLERAHALLRAKLDRGFEGGRGAWCAVLAPLARTGFIAAASGTGALLVGTKATVGVAAAVVAFAGWVAWDAGRAEVAPPEAGEAREPTPVEHAALAPANPNPAEVASSSQRAALSSSAQVGRVVRIVSAGTRAPIGDALVLALDGAREVARARTDADGRATLPAGFAALRVAACAEGHNTVAAEVDDPALIQLELRREGVLSGTLAIDGLPPGRPVELSVWTTRGVGDLALLHPFAAALRGEGGFHERGAILTDADGRFELRGLDPDWSGRLHVTGALRIRGTTPALPTREHEYLELRKPLTDLRLETTLLPVLRGRVVSAEDGAPIAQARVDVLVVFEGGELRTPYTGCQADEHGGFELALQPNVTSEQESWLDPARRVPVERIRIYLHGGEEVSDVEFEFEADELADPLDVGDLAVARSAPLWFRVVDDAGRPIAGARVEAEGRASPATDEQGRATLRGLAAGPGELTAAAFGHHVLLVQHGAERGSEDEPLTLTLEPGNVIEIQLAGPEGKKPEGLAVELSLPHDAFAAVESLRIGITAHERIAGPFGGRSWLSGRMKLGLRPHVNGKLAISGLLPGIEGELRVTDRMGQLAATQRFVAPPDGERLVLRVEVDSPEIELRGRVLDEDGAPIARAEINAQLEHERSRVLTDADGRFTLGPLLARAGTVVVVEASYPGRVTRRCEDVRLAASTPPLELVLEPGRALEVELVEASGGPAPAEYLGARGPDIATVYAELEGDRFVFERLPPGEVEIVTNIGGTVHRFRARGADGRARFTLPDHGALAVELPAELVHPGELRARLTRPGDAAFEHLAALDEPIALLPGSYLVELVREEWTQGEHLLERLDGPRAVEVRAGETARVQLGR